VSLSPISVTVAAPVAGEIGQGVNFLFDQIGFVRGTVARLVSGGFHVEIAGSQSDHEKLAAKINWLKSHRQRKAIDKREAARHFPRVPSAFFYLADGTEHACFLIDISLSGAGLSAQLRAAGLASFTVAPLRDRADLDSLLSGTAERTLSAGNVQAH
jgi:hypothetical protein